MASSPRSLTAKSKKPSGKMPPFGSHLTSARALRRSLKSASLGGASGEHAGFGGAFAGTLCGNRPDGRGLSRQSLYLVRGGASRISPPIGNLLPRNGAESQLLDGGGRRALSLSSPRPL